MVSRIQSSPLKSNSSAGHCPDTVPPGNVAHLHIVYDAEATAAALRLFLRAVQFIYKSSHGGVNVMDPQRSEIQECFTRAGVEMDSWKYAWRVRATASVVLGNTATPAKPSAALVPRSRDYAAGIMLHRLRYAV